jgi:predicted small secreted protein
MKTRNFFKRKILVPVLAISFMLMAGCNKDDNTTGTTGFTPADFLLTVIAHGQGTGNSYYSVEYTVKNISTKKYDINSNDDLVVKLRVRDNSGNTFTSAPLIPTLEPGATQSNKTTISLPSGVVVSSSTFTAAVEKE